MVSLLDGVRCALDPIVANMTYVYPPFIRPIRRAGSVSAQTRIMA